MLIVSFLAVAVYGQETASKPVAEEMIGPSGISWAPMVSYSRLVLTISRPDGTVFTTTFESGKTPYVALGSILGGSDSDGSYTYELRVIPTEAQNIRREIQLKDVGGNRLATHKALTQSGYFFVQGGAIVLPDEPEGSARESIGTGNVAPDSSQEGLSGTSDICYADDLIVDGSLCVGFDCTCNYSFGFDTIVLKENNLRIFFDDTSVAGGFPNNDWRMIINDSANGGAEYFGVEDSTAGRRVFTLEAGAPSHSLYVDDGGRVGFGTSTPVVDLHAVSGNTPTLRLEQDGSSGFAPQTWDVAGNETSFFIRDATNGSTLPFRIRPGAGSNSLVIDSDSDVGVGILSPNAPLHVKDNAGAASTVMELENNGPTKFRLNNSTADYWDFNSSNNGLRMNANGSGTVAFRLDTNGDVTIAGTLTTAGNVYPDYVFAPGYNLLPMEELARHIEEKGHLPNIPSAEEMKKNGINMSDLQMRLLEKVEELTLYTLSQEEIIKVQKKAINHQIEAIKKLEARLEALENKNQ